MVSHSPTSKLAVSLSTKPWLKNQNQASKHTQMPTFHLRPAKTLGLGEDLCLREWQIFIPAAPCGASLLINLQSSQFSQTDVCTNSNSATHLGTWGYSSRIWHMVLSLHKISIHLIRRFFCKSERVTLTISVMR